MKHFFFVIAAWAMFALTQGHAQNPTENFPPPTLPPRLVATETTEKIVADGRLMEAVWQTAPVVQDFFRMEPRQGGAVRYPTRVQVVFDKKNLYFGVFCRDSMGRKGVRVQDYRRDFEYGENDIFFLQLDPQNLRRYCMSFQATPIGTQRDLQVFDDSFRDNDWDALWRVRTSVVDSGWYAEFAIPFKTLRYEVPKKTDSLHWGITLARLARRDYEQSVFPAVPQAFSPYRMSYAAQLQGLKLPPPAANVRVQPYALYQYDRARNAQGVEDQMDNFKMGGEVKWAMNPHAVLDLTFNTDFAQADVDRAVNNLTRFNVFFPERRQFFLENSGVYAGADIDGVKPFFSRSIGLANSQFNADPVPIDVGARYTDRNAKRTIAGLYVHQRGTDLQGGANFGVLRYAHNYRKQDNVGIMLTHRYDEADRERVFLENHNTTLTLDGFNRPNEDWTTNYLLSLSRDQASGKTGTAGSLYAGYFPNKWYFGTVSKWVTRDYLPGMGFVFANDVVQHNPGGYRILRPTGKLSKIVRRYDPGVFLDIYHDASRGRFQSARLDIFPVFIIFQDNSLLDMTYHPTWESFFFEPLSIQVAPGHYFFHRFEIRYRTDASKKISADVKYYGGEYYDGALDEWSASLRLAPSPKIALTGSYELNRIRDLGIERTTKDIAIYTAGLRLAHNPRLQASLFYQYNDLDQRGRWNVRGSWEFQPLSFLFVVFNETNFRESPVRNQSLISKVSYLRQF
jgi:hypothetical protein